jgi:MFS family permease
MGFFGVGALIGAYAGGWLTDKLGYYPVQFWSLVANGIVLLLMMLVQSFWMMCFTVLVLSITADIFRPANSIAIAVYSNAETRTRSVSLYRMAVNLGWAIAPVLGGLLATLGWNWLFWIDGLTCIFAALMLRYLLPEKEAKKTEETPVLEHAQNKAPLKYGAIFSDRLFVLFLGLTMADLGGASFFRRRACLVES